MHVFFPASGRPQSKKNGNELRKTDLGHLVHLFRVKITLLSRHVFCQGKKLHFLFDRGPNDLFKRVSCMMAELPRVTMMREWHFFVSNFALFKRKSLPRLNNASL